jgi:anaerobic selenocysteine-containing dehydrogenase
LPPVDSRFLSVCAPLRRRSAGDQSEERIVWGACSVNCGSRCALRLHVRDNEVTWVETDNTGDG